MSKIHELAEVGQSIWLDYIRRSFITSGELNDWVARGLRGVTSNPSIFEKAIAGSGDYDDALHSLVAAGESTAQIYEALVVEDIQLAADVLRPVFDRTEGRDGYVSLEVSPELARDSAGTIAEARRLHAAVNRPNLMIKVPATAEGVPAIEKLIGEGLNINVTLMFSLEQYEAVAEAYLSGLERLLAVEGDLGSVASVASFFVSRVDVALDSRLEASGAPELKGQIAIANARLAYARFLELFTSERWRRLADQGARVQRLLWASTSTKSPEFPDTLYVDNLIGPDTVNTVPPATLNAFLDHGTVARTLDRDLSGARERIRRLADLGIDLDQITDRLLEEGVAAFEKSFQSLRRTIEHKRELLLAGWEHSTAHLNSYEKAIEAALDEMTAGDILARIWAHDYTVWKPDPNEIANRLGWLHSPEIMRAQIPRLREFARQICDSGIERVIVLGMGGSSLAPDVFWRTFGTVNGYPLVTVLDTTSPDAIRTAEKSIDPERTLFLVSTKSGTTVESLSLFKYFYNRMHEAVGPERAGMHFVAITDPGSPLLQIAEQYSFRDRFINDPNIGGRYSALSFFGLVPAALLGMDLERLLDRAQAMACGCESCVGAHENPGAWFGAVLGELARAGRDKLTICASGPLESFGDWVEQLIAESTGKEGRGVLPVVGEELGTASAYGADRLFVHLRLDGDDALDSRLKQLAEAGHPVVTFHLHDLYDLGGQIFLWELATAIAGYRLGINPFDQPNVESAKVRAREMVAAYQENGRLPEIKIALSEDDLDFSGDIKASNPEIALLEFLKQADPGDPKTGAGRSYVTLQAYLPPDEEATGVLQTLRHRIRDYTRLATTVGYGPRFLHSTGQLHKGDAGHGLFIQFTTMPERDIPIPNEAGRPDSDITFGVLIEAQALGDRQALLDAGRRVARFRLRGSITGLISRLAEALG